ncbi:MAG: antitoxin [Nitrospinota bacterium]
MGTITIRGIDDEIAMALKKQAKKENTSINSIVLKIVKESLGLRKKGRTVTYTDLDHLAGTWDEKDYTEFQNRVADFEVIDENLWK